MLLYDYGNMMCYTIQQHIAWTIVHATFYNPYLTPWQHTIPNTIHSAHGYTYNSTTKYMFNNTIHIDHTQPISKTGIYVTRTPNCTYQSYITLLIPPVVSLLCSLVLSQNSVNMY